MRREKSQLSLFLKIHVRIIFQVKPLLLVLRMNCIIHISSKIGKLVWFYRKYHCNRSSSGYKNVFTDKHKLIKMNSELYAQGKRHLRWLEFQIYSYAKAIQDNIILVSMLMGHICRSIGVKCKLMSVIFFGSYLFLTKGRTDEGVGWCCGCMHYGRANRKMLFFF